MKLEDFRTTNLTNAQIREWLHTHIVEFQNHNSRVKYEILPNKVVDIEGDINFLPSTPDIPFKFGRIKGGSFIADGVSWTTLKNCPESVGSAFIIKDQSMNRVGHCTFPDLRGLPKRVASSLTINVKSVRSIEGLSSHILGSVYLYDGFITSLHDIHKYCKHIGNKFIIGGSQGGGAKVSDSVLGVLLIGGLKVLEVSGWNNNPASGTWVGIINKHLASGRDIIACQHELIEAGFEKYARL